MTIKIQSKEIQEVSVNSLAPHPKNMNKHSDEQIERLCKIIEYQGFRNPLIVQKGTNLVVAGHGRIMAAKKLGIEKVPVMYQEFESEEQLYAAIVSDNSIASWAELDLSMVNAELENLGPDLDIDLLGIKDFVIEPIEKFENEINSNSSLADRFGAPPLSIIDAKQGYWQDRKRKWLSSGIKSEIGRRNNMLKHNPKIQAQFGMEGKETSIFDPALCEVFYSWFSKKEDKILDPFSGGSVRGLVCSNLERHYLGIDLRAEQIEANKKQLGIANQDYMPIWKQGDSLKIKSIAGDYKADMIFSCPPYADLEVYSDDPSDLSNMEYEKFKDIYSVIIKNCYELLENDRFACFVVGEVRDKKGNYYNFVGDTVKSFIDAGFSYYNEIIFATPLGSVQVRCGKPFKTSRKVGKTHQNILVFVKGDAKKATQRLGDIHIQELGVADHD
jgi:DNA modification methylase